MFKYENATLLLLSVKWYQKINYCANVGRRLMAPFQVYVA